MKVGDLAKQTGLSVRTLHYYDEIGLLQPRDVTSSGHRVYGADELARLQRIKSLRQLGFSLDEIRACLDAPEFSAHRVIELHIKRLREQIGEQERLVGLLETLDASFEAGTIASPDELIRAIESMTSLEREFTAEEWTEIKERGERLGRDHVRAVEREWPPLIARMRAAMLARRRSRERRRSAARDPMARARARVHRRESGDRAEGPRGLPERPGSNEASGSRSGPLRLRESGAFARSTGSLVERRQRARSRR